MPTGCRSVYLEVREEMVSALNMRVFPEMQRKKRSAGDIGQGNNGGIFDAHRLVISKVVPKIWARTKSAMVRG
jgi:hypothetical protein